MNNILAFATNLLNIVSFEEAPKATVQEAMLYAIIGFAVVFVGIALLIAIVWLVGKILGGARQEEAQPTKVVPVVSAETTTHQDNDEVDEETVAVITAAIMAYYEQQGNRCDFIVKRIKRIKRY